MPDEAAFQKWYAGHAQRLGLDPNPDAPEHFYDYRAAFAAGAGPGKDGHWPSEFKREGHPRMVLGGINTKTGMPVNDDLRAGKVDWDEDAILMEKLKSKLPLLAAGGVTSLALRGGPAVAVNLGRQSALASALRNRVKESVDRYFGP